MQFTPIFLFTIICGYSLVISAPVSQKTPESQETKQQKATAIASRLLKEIAGEQQIEPNNKEQTSNNNDEKKDNVVPVNQPSIEKVESHIENQNQNQNQNNDDDDDENDVDLIPTLDDLYELYGDKYSQTPIDEESSSEDIDDEYILPMDKQQLIRYLIEQEESDENSAPVIHTPIIDDKLMTAENHQRRRRRSIY